MTSFLRGAVRLKNKQAKILKQGLPWVYSNELAKIDKSLAPGSWVALEDSDGKSLGYGFFNPHSLIAFRIFERRGFESEDQTRALFYKKMDWAWQTRTRAYGERIAAGEVGRYSFRLAFGESDGLPGFVVDLYHLGSGGVAVLQCHAAGADQFIFWAQQWFSERMGIDCGIVRNDLDVRRRENAKLEKIEWGTWPSGDAYCVEGGVKFFVDPRAGQKTGYFYDLRDSRGEFARVVGQADSRKIVDCFSFMGSWGLQALKKNPKAHLTAIDVSGPALEMLERNAKENGLADRVKIVKADLFKDFTSPDRSPVRFGEFDAVVCDPPSLSSSAKQANEGRRAHQSCFETAVRLATRDRALFAFASCSFHLSWDDFLMTIARASFVGGRELKFTHVGSQGADHPILSTLLETRYLKSVIAEG